MNNIERFTKRDADFQAHIIGIDSRRLLSDLTMEQYNRLLRAFDRLAEYEETELSPRDVRIQLVMAEDDGK